MPVVQRSHDAGDWQLFGIIVRVYCGKAGHNPPHIHVRYQDHTAIFDIAAANGAALCPKVLYTATTYASGQLSSRLSHA